MTRQEAVFDEDLDFDRFFLTRFVGEGTEIITFSTSSNFRGCRESGFALAILHSTKNYYA